MNWPPKSDISHSAFVRMAHARVSAVAGDALPSSRPSSAVTRTTSSFATPRGAARDARSRFDPLALSRGEYRYDRPAKVRESLRGHDPLPVDGRRAGGQQRAPGDADGHGAG